MISNLLYLAKCMDHFFLRSTALVQSKTPIQVLQIVFIQISPTSVHLRVLYLNYYSKVL